jgi:hypothetical protein
MEIEDIKEWKSGDLKIITVTQDVGSASYNLQVREFLPIEGDSLNRVWNSRNGQKHHPCTPYAIANMRQMSRVIDQFVDDNIETFIDYYIDRTDKLMYSTYKTAYQYSRQVERGEESQLLFSVLRLWVACRMESKQERILGGETLGMTTQESDPDAGNYGKYLVPPVMLAQIEIITTTAVLLPMKRAVLRGLQKLVDANQTKSWFTIYLCMFILLHSCATLTKAENVRALREGTTGHQVRV